MADVIHMRGTDEATAAAADANARRLRHGTADKNASRGSEEAAGSARPAFDLDAPELYLNRELTWLEFNRPRAARGARTSAIRCSSA